jgi:hypothetical protein
LFMTGIANKIQQDGVASQHLTFKIQHSLLF